MMYFCLLLSSFVALYSGQTLCVYMGCTDIDYCIYDICGLWMVLVFFYGYVYGYVYGCVWVCVWVMCMDTGSRSSARPGSINIGAYLSLGPVSIIIGTYSLLEARFIITRFLRPTSIIIGTYSLLEARFIIIGSYSFTRPVSIITRFSRPISSLSGLTPSRGPFHSRTYSFTRPI
jgi:hypothetical protein